MIFTKGSDKPMKPTHSIHSSREIPATQSAIWERISNHAETHRWVLPARVRLLSTGEPRPNGKGAVREVSFPEKKLWPTIQERVTAFDAPSTFSYTIIAGQAGLRDHLGTLTIESLDKNRSRVTWHIDFQFSRWHPIGWLAGPLTRNFGKVVTAALDELARQMRA
jgi:hypothetical protein